MKTYGQIYLNIGHVIKAILKYDDFSKALFTPEETNCILKLATQSRDLKVNLKDNELIKERVDCDYKIYRGTFEDLKRVTEFVLSEFNVNWAMNVKKGFINEVVTVFYIENEKEVIGFGAYDVIDKGVFDPMGVSLKFRSRNIGAKIVKTILRDMEENGYENIVIDDAGPIEFYERACEAKVY